MLKNIGQLIKQLKPKLEEYLNSQGINTSGKLFKCPNFKKHHREDLKPSCNFFPDKTMFKCFACEYRKGGDIFDAVKLLEGKDITGENFYEVIKYLCKKFNIPYIETTTEEDKFFKKISTTLNRIVNIAHVQLKNEIKTNKELKQFLKSKGWIKAIDTFKLGYFKNVPSLDLNEDVLAYLNLADKQNPSKLTKKLANRIIIPVTNYRGEIVGITCRTIKKDDTISKYMHYFASNIKNLLFNINNINPKELVYLVEGPSSVLTLYGYGITNVVASFGNHLHNNQSELLIRKKVNHLVVLFDNDFGGNEGLRSSLDLLSKQSEIEKIEIGILPENNDPGEYVLQGGKLEDLSFINLLDYLYEKYHNNTNDKYIEKCLAQYVNGIQDIVAKENIINTLSKKLKINKTTLLELINLYAQVDNNLKISDLLKEKEALIQTLNDFERWTWSRGKLLGLSSFKVFDDKLDGIQQGLTLIGGSPNSGKSATQISLTIKILQNNKDVYLVYFTIDDPLYVTLARFIANLSGLPINVVSNPNYKIMKANLPEKVKQDYINRREQAIEFLRKNASFFTLKDSSEGLTIEQIKEKLQTLHALSQGKRLVIVIDNLHNLRSKRNITSDKHLFSLISNELSQIANSYKCPVIASSHITKEAIKTKNFDGTAIKETVELYFDAKLILMIDTEEDKELDSVQDDVELTIHIPKNKMSGFKGKIPFIFYRSLSKVEELGNNEQSQIFE